MKAALMESNVKSNDVIELLLHHYYLLLCEGCSNYDFEKVYPRSSKVKKSKSEIIVASPRNLSEARLFAKSRIVDIVSFGASNLRYLDSSQVELLIQSGKAIELRINELITDYKALGRLRRFASLLINKEIATSFTCSPSRALEICVPHQVISLLKTLELGEEDSLTLWSLSTNYVLSLVESKGMKKVLRRD